VPVSSFPYVGCQAGFGQHPLYVASSTSSPAQEARLFSYVVKMVRAQAEAGDTAAGTVQRILPSLKTAVHVAVETVAPASAAVVKHKERRLCQKMREGL